MFSCAQVRVYDIGAPLPSKSSKTTVRVVIINVDEPPVFRGVSSTSCSVAETTAAAGGSALGDVLSGCVVVAVDTDVPGSTLEYSVLSINNLEAAVSPAFEVDKTSGQVRIGQSGSGPNYELSKEYLLEIQAQEIGTAMKYTATTNVLVTINLINEPPAIVASSKVNQTVPKNAKQGTPEYLPKSSYTNRLL